MKKYRVRIAAIVWDDGKGEYDVSDLPSCVRYVVEASSQSEAIEVALDRATDDNGFLILESEILACEANPDAG